MRAREVSPGFTLVEMLVAIAVLLILVLLIAQLFNSATATTTLSRRNIAADEEARMVLDRMGSDFAGMVRRPDVNYIFCKNAGAGSTGTSDAMFFYSEGPGYLSTSATSAMGTTGSASTMALVGFRINSNNQFYSGIPVMERLGENLTWSGTADGTGTFPGGMVYLPNPLSALFSMPGNWFPTLAGNWSYTLGAPPYAPSSSNYDTSHFQLLSDQVFRMEFCFLLNSGTYALSGTNVVTGTTGYSNAPTAIGISPSAGGCVTGTANGNNYFTGASPLGPADLAGNVYGFPPDLAGIVVTIAVLDSASRKILPAGALGKLGGALNDSLPLNPPSGISATPGDTTVGNVYSAPPSTAQLWQSQIQTSGFAQSLGFPQSALGQVRIYERTFYLNSN